MKSLRATSPAAPWARLDQWVRQGLTASEARSRAVWVMVSSWLALCLWKRGIGPGCGSAALVVSLPDLAALNGALGHRRAVSQPDRCHIGGQVCYEMRAPMGSDERPSGLCVGSGPRCRTAFPLSMTRTLSSTVPSNAASAEWNTRVLHWRRIWARPRTWSGWAWVTTTRRCHSSYARVRQGCQAQCSLRLPTQHQPK